MTTDSGSSMAAMAVLGCRLPLIFLIAASVDVAV